MQKGNLTFNDINAMEGQKIYRYDENGQVYHIIRIKGKTVNYYSLDDNGMFLNYDCKTAY